MPFTRQCTRTVFLCSTRNLMIGKNILWVAKQHGHSTVTMLRTYAAWVEGAVDTDVEAIKRSMYLIPDPTDRSSGDGPRLPPGDQGSSILENLAVEELIRVPSLPAVAPADGPARDLSDWF